MKDMRVSSEWWAEHMSEDDRYRLELSGKITLLSEVLKMSEAIGDKVYVLLDRCNLLDLLNLMGMFGCVGKVQDPYLVQSLG